MDSAPYDDTDPVGEANDADVAEQLSSVDDDRHDEQVNVDVEADAADLAEQSRPVPEIDDDYPRT